MSSQLIKKSKAFYQQYEFLNSLNYARKAFRQAKKAQDGLFIIESLYMITKSLLSLSKFDNALERCNESLCLLNKKQKDIDQKSYLSWISCFYAIKGRILFKKGDFDASENYYNKCLPISRQLNNNKKIAFALNGLGTVNDIKGNLIKAIDYINEAINCELKINDDKGISWSFLYMGNLLFQRGSLESGLFYYERSLEKARISNNLTVICYALNGIGTIYQRSGQLELALENFTNAHILANQIADAYNSAMILMNIALIYKDQGRINLALIFLKKCLAMGREIVNDFDLTYVYDLFGEIYKKQGQLNKAKHYFQKSLIIRKEIGNNSWLSSSHEHIGELYYLQGNFNESMRYYTESLRLRENLGNNIELSAILYYIINLLISQSKIEEARNYFSKLIKIPNIENNAYIDLFQKVSEALMKKSLPSIFQKNKAKEIFSEILSNKRSNQQTQIVCKIHLCQILIYDFQMTKEPENLNEINQIIHELYIHAEDEKNFLLKLDLLILKAQIATLCENYTETYELLDEGYKIAQKKGYALFIKKIKEKEEELHLPKKFKFPSNYKIAVTTHELKKPITIIKGFTEFLLKHINEAEPDDREQALRLILKNTIHLNSLIEEINELSSLKQGFLKCSKEIVEFNDFFNDLIAQYEVIYGSKIVYNDEIRRNEKLMVFIDQSRIQQVFDNIIENADRFTLETGHIWINKNWYQRDVIVQITDDGQGIDQEGIKKIFDPFSTLVTDSSYQGMGIGLFLAKVICDEHQASLKVTSSGIGQGTTFSIIIKRFE